MSLDMGSLAEAIMDIQIYTFKNLYVNVYEHIPNEKLATKVIAVYLSTIDTDNKDFEDLSEYRFTSEKHTFKKRLSLFKDAFGETIMEDVARIKHIGSNIYRLGVDLNQLTELPRGLEFRWINNATTGLHFLEDKIISYYQDTKSSEI